MLALVYPQTFELIRKLITIFTCGEAMQVYKSSFSFSFFIHYQTLSITGKMAMVILF